MLWDDERQQRPRTQLHHHSLQHVRGSAGDSSKRSMPAAKSLNETFRLRDMIRPIPMEGLEQQASIAVGERSRGAHVQRAVMMTWWPT